MGDDSNLDCGLNGALYFVQMDADGGKSKYGNAGAEMGLGYCDAQCPHDLKFINNEANMDDWKPSESDPNAGTGKYGSCCTEIDIWEANKISSAYTMHACSEGVQQRCSGTDCGDNGADRFKGLCDKNGCDIQSYRLGNKNFFGPGSNFQVDSTLPTQMTIVLIGLLRLKMAPTSWTRVVLERLRRRSILVFQQMWNLSRPMLMLSSPTSRLDQLAPQSQVQLQCPQPHRLPQHHLTVLVAL